MPSEYYSTFLDIVRNLLDGNIDASQYEDTLREMFGIHAYIAFTLDKVVQNCVRQLQYLVQEDTCTQLRHMFHDEQRHHHGEHKVAHMLLASVQSAEQAYQKRVETLLSDQNCFKIVCYKNSGQLSIEMLDTESGDSEGEQEGAEIEKWSEFVDKWCAASATIASTQLVAAEPITASQVPDEVKEALLRNPVFLPR